jgi:hypothetical protein
MSIMNRWQRKTLPMLCRKVNHEQMHSLGLQYRRLRYGIVALLWHSRVSMVAQEGCLDLNNINTGMSRQTYIRLSFQYFGDGREGVKMTPIWASASSVANKCASVAPVMVICMDFLFSSSISFFRMINVAIMSALWASITNGNVP